MFECKINESADLPRWVADKLAYMKKYKQKHIIDIADSRYALFVKKGWVSQGRYYHWERIDCTCLCCGKKHTASRKKVYGTVKE